MHSVLDDDVLDLLRAFDAIEACRPRWHADAACRGHGVEAFFPALGGDGRAAKALCATCPVSGPCLAFAVETEAAGIWGATSPRERRKLRKVSQAPSTVDEWSDGARSATAS